MKNSEFIEIKPLLQENPTARSLEFLQQMAQRRSIRKFSNQPVDLEILLNAMKTAGTAPSGAGYPQSPIKVPDIQRKPISDIMTVY